MKNILSPYTVPVQLNEELKSSKSQTSITSNIIKLDLHPWAFQARKLFNVKYLTEADNENSHIVLNKKKLNLIIMLFFSITAFV
jgi:hypothetical protein